VSKAKPSFVSFEGFVDAMVIVDGLRKAGAALTRDKFVDAIESRHNVDIGLGQSARLMYGPHHHQGLGHVYPTVVRGGKPELIADWQAG
jgi:branched-chain amino acid transport system substrate-binding protein